MRISQSGWMTFKETPKEAEIISHQLMLRAGLVHKLTSGLYNYLPLAHRSIQKVKKIIREELDLIGCLEITMSMVTHAELWKESGRWEVMGPQMAKFIDRGDKEMCLSPTNEETVTDLFRKFIHSYKQLPITYYQINTKFRDEIRPRFGLMRAREFIMKDAYSFHIDHKSLDDFYDKIFQAYVNIFKRMGLNFAAVEADGGAMASGDSKTHEFQVIASNGEDTLVYCAENNWGANIEKAKTLRHQSYKFKIYQDEDLVSIDTPTTIHGMQDLAIFLKVPLELTLKSVLYRAYNSTTEFKLILAVVLGDDEVNEVKVKNALNLFHLEVASSEDLKQYNLTPGFLGPHRLPESINIIIDQSINESHSYIIGGNAIGIHLQNYCIKKHLKTSCQKIDIRLAKEGDTTLDGKKIEIKKGIEVGHIFQLGKKYTSAMQVSVLGQDGKPVVPLMGCYGIGVTRILPASIEQSHDGNGIVWPKSIAPYEIYFCRIAKTEKYKMMADECYENLLSHGLEVFYDDRDVSPGVMFKDSDLIGLPLRVLFGERELEASQRVEIKNRKTGEVVMCPYQNLPTLLQEILKGMS